MALTDGQLVKGTGPEIYVIQNGKRCWIPDPVTFDLIGYNWAAVQTVPDAQLNAVPLGPQIDAVAKYIFPAPWDTPADGNSLWQHDGMLWCRYLSPGGGHTVLGRGELDFASGQIHGTLLACNGVAFTGFQGGMVGLCYDSNKILLGTTPMVKAGANPTGWPGAPNQWSIPAPLNANVGSDMASRTRYFKTIVTDEPATLQDILNKTLKPLITTLDDLAPLVQAIGSIFSSKPATSGDKPPAKPATSGDQPPAKPATSGNQPKQPANSSSLETLSRATEIKTLPPVKQPSH